MHPSLPDFGQPGFKGKWVKRIARGKVRRSRSLAGEADQTAVATWKNVGREFGED